MVGTEKVGFEFPYDDSQQWDGFNEPGVEHFSGSPFRSLGREGTQNALDATRKSPARIKIQKIDVLTSTIPDVKGLQATIRRCKKDAGQESSKAVAFFDLANELLSKKRISVLQFSDSNTKGVRGPCENGTPYFALMKATGQSKKDSGTATGSFGIGKFAPYTVSGLRTVFLSTAWKAGDGSVQHYVQGKSILMSHREGARTHRGTGFWGVRKNCAPWIGQLKHLPDWLRREGPDAVGTTLSILGFAGIKDWEKVLAASIAESFFGAINKGDLEVEIAGDLAIKRATLQKIFADQGIISAIRDQKDEPETFENSKYFLSALTSSEAKIEDTENAGLGHCKLHVLVGEGLPKKVAILRNGMLITSELAGLRRFAEFKEFVAVLECQSEKGNELLRAMEPPAHNDFETARLLPSQQRTAQVALREISKWIREMLQRHAKDPVAEVTEIDELAEFFGDEGESKSGDARNGEINPLGTIKIRARPVRRRPDSSSVVGNQIVSQDGDEPGDQGDGEGSGSGSQTGQGSGGGANDASGGSASSGGGAKGSAGASSVQLRNVRSVVLGPSRRRIAFTAEKAGKLRVELEDSGADTNRSLRLETTSVEEIDDGRLIVVCLAGQRVVADVDLTAEFDGTMRIKGNAV